MTYARKVDANHGVIKKAFLTMGCSVRDVFRVGDDFPDLHVGIFGIDQLVEVKPKGGKLSEGQQEFHRDWKGRKPVVARTAEDTALIVSDMGTMARKLRT